MNLITQIIQRVPDALANYAYPRFLAAFVKSLQTSMNLSNAEVRVIGTDLRAALDPPQPLDPDGPLAALVTVITEALLIMDFTLDTTTVAPFLMAVGDKIVADPQFA